MMMVMRISIKHWHAAVVLSTYIYLFILFYWQAARHPRLLKLHAIYNPPLHPTASIFYSQLTLWYCFNKRVLRIKPAALFVYVQRGMTSGDCENNTDKYVVIGMADSTFCNLLRSPAKSKMECQ